jgi:hypothetical protein
VKSATKRKKHVTIQPVYGDTFHPELLTEQILEIVERRASEYDNNINKEQSERLSLYYDKSRETDIDKNPFSEKNSGEIGEIFSNYLEHLNLAFDPNILILSSSSHYYYESEELKKVKTLVNLKQLNHITQLNEFLDSIFLILQPESYLIGCFSDNKNPYRFLSDSHSSQNISSTHFDMVENGISSRIPFLNMIYNIMDIKTNRYMTRNTVTLHLEEAGMSVLDMTEINGLTFFCAQKNH